MADLIALAQQLGELLSRRHWRVTCAESCTGGAVAAAITEVAGCSRWFETSFVTYANSSKEQLLGVAKSTLEVYGAVSETVVEEMAQGARLRANADIAVAVSGIAGPGGGSDDKPVGTVWLAWSTATETQARCFYFDGDRQAVRRQAVMAALEGLNQRVLGTV